MLSKFVVTMIASYALAAEPSHPSWDTSKVFIIEAGDSSAQTKIDQVLSQNGGHEPPCNGQWSDGRYAFFFKPGDHSSLNMEVGYYTTVHGLGRSPVNTILGNLMAQNGDFDYTIGALNNFWRGAENVMVTPASGTPMLWAVSQASPLRRIQVNGDLQLFQYNYGCCAGFASGGYMADMYITGKVTPGSQQQWFSRNAHIGYADPAVWNGVWVGCPGAPSNHCSNIGGAPNTTVNSSPVVVEKPYIVYDQGYKLMRPKAEYNKVGNTANWQNADEIDFSKVYVANDNDSAQTINAKLAEGLHLVLQPGIYKLSESLKVTYTNQVVLGLGLATLIPQNGDAAIEVSNVDGVRIAGLMLEAGKDNSEALLMFGTSDYEGNYYNPGSISDVFARSGRFYQDNQDHVAADKFIVVNTGNTVIDDIWMWRADHDLYGLVVNSENPVAVGLEVNGDNVVGYGLAVEHVLGDMTLWNGDNGKSYFYQAEFPYDVTQSNYGDRGYAAYKVADSVTRHEGFGIGAYTYFRDNTVVVTSGIKCPNKNGVAFHNSISVFLNGNGEVSHVINDQGDASKNGQTPNYVCEYGSPSYMDLFLQ